MDDSLKKCTLCGVVKPDTEFHMNSRFKSGLDCWCKSCKSTRAKANPWHKSAAGQAYYSEYNASDKGKACKAKSRQKRSPEEHAAYMRGLYIKRVYGLSPEDWDAMLASQGGGCAICGCADKLTVDHNHDTMAVRGILCQWCNSGLGQLRDSEDRLGKALEYLKARRP